MRWSHWCTKQLFSWSRTTSMVLSLSQMMSISEILNYSSRATNANHRPVYITHGVFKLHSWFDSICWLVVTRICKQCKTSSILLNFCAPNQIPSKPAQIVRYQALSMPRILTKIIDQNGPIAESLVCTRSFIISIQHLFGSLTEKWEGI